MVLHWLKTSCTLDNGHYIVVDNYYHSKLTKMPPEKILVSSSDCEMLLNLRYYRTLTGMADGLGLDKSYLSKRLARIASEAPVLEKINGKWSLNSRGIELVKWYEQALQDQQAILKNNQTFTIAVTQLISERIMVGLIPELKEVLKSEKLFLTSTINDLEEALLVDKINFALTCGIPNSPEIRYKKVFKSPLAVVVPNSWKENFDNVVELFNHKPYAAHSSMNLRKILSINEEVPEAVLVFDHLSGVREAVSQGLTWSILPLYAIQREIEKKSVKVFKLLPIKEEFQLWWHPQRISKGLSTALVEVLNRSNA